MTDARLVFRITALLGALAVGLGAFGAHGLRDLLLRNETLQIWEKAVFYQFIHVAVMFALSLCADERKRLGPWLCFLAGVLIFSGSLYVLAVTNIRWLGAITPLGGLSFIAGWVWLVFQPPFQSPQTGKEMSSHQDVR